MKTLSIGMWFALTFILLVGITACFGIVIAILPTVLPPQNQAVLEQRSSVLQEITASSSHWNDPLWQKSINARVTSAGMTVIVKDAAGHSVYSNDPTAALSSADASQVIVMTGDTQQKEIAYVYYEKALSRNQGSFLLILFSATCLLVMASMAWFTSRAILKPLAEITYAAGRIATNNLDFHLPTSRIKEIARVTTAFQAMSTALRTSIHRQAELEQERRFFISAIAHDLRTPLFSLRGYLEGLEKGVANTPEKIEKYIRVCQEKATALERLITDFFVYTQLEYLGQMPQKEPLALRTLLQQTIDGLQLLAEEKGIIVHLTGPSEPCLLEGDRHLLTRAIENLLDNAIRYTPAGGTIHVNYRQESDQFVFTVKDTGPGISSHDLPHVFTPLYRGETSRNRQTGGAGLGLAIAQHILQAHGGDLTAANAPQGGAIFSGMLVRRKDEAG